MKTIRPAFTLIELLVVIGIIAILISLVVPAVQKLREVSNNVSALANIKQIALAIHNCHDTNKRMPPAYGKMGALSEDHSWAIHLLPFLEQDGLYQKFVTGQGNKAQVVSIFNVALDPSPHDGKSVINFAVNLRVFTAEGFREGIDPQSNSQAAFITSGDGRPTLAHSFPDGSSNVVILATRYGHDRKSFPGGIVGCSAYSHPYVPEGRGSYFGRLIARALAEQSDREDLTFQLAPDPEYVKCTSAAPQSFTPRGIQIAMGDGSARTVHPSVSVKTWNAAITPNDEQPLGVDWYVDWDNKK